MNEIFYQYLINNDVSLDHIIQFSFDNVNHLMAFKRAMKINKLNKKEIDLIAINGFINNQIKDDKKCYFLLDEIQELEGFESLLNTLMQIKNSDVYVTGTNTKFLSKDIATEFAGRSTVIRVYPLSFAEFYEYKKGNEFDVLIEYMQYGGLPQVVLSSDKLTKQEILRTILEETYLIDAKNRYRINNSVLLREILIELILSSGKTFSPTNLKNKLRTKLNIKTSEKTINKYVEHFTDAFLINTSMI